MRNLVALVFAPLALAAALSAQFTFTAQGPPLTASSSNTPPDQKCVVAGRVTNSQTGEPLKKVAIRLQRHTAGPASTGTVSALPFPAQQGYSTTSDADGSFRIEAVEPGDYTLSGQRTGYLNTQYGAKSPMQPGTTLNLRPAQQLTGLSLALLPQAVISGKVVDEDGDPVAGAMVQVLGQMWQRGKLRNVPHGSGQTNDLGEFRSANLSPGKYYVCVQKMNFGMMNEAPPEPGKPDIRPIRTCYPEATTLDAATQLAVKAGQDLPDINIRMHSAQTYHVRGKVAGNVPAERARIFLSRQDEQMFFLGNQAAIGKDQSFDIAGVAPGSYTLNVLVMGRGTRSGASQPVDVGQGDVNDVAVNMVEPGALRGTVRIEGTPQAGVTAVNFASLHVSLSPAAVGGMIGGAPNGRPNADGAFTLENVFPGKYYVETNAPAGTYLKSVRFGQQEIPDKEVDLSQGASGDLEIVFRYGAAEIDGTVQASGSSQTSQPPASASIVLIPDVLNADGSGIHFSDGSQGGAFTLKQIPPGHYRVYAFEQIDRNQLQNPDLQKQLQGMGTEVEVQENDKKQMQVPLISADQLNQVYAGLGIESVQ